MQNMPRLGQTRARALGVCVRNAQPGKTSGLPDNHSGGSRGRSRAFLPLVLKANKNSSLTAEKVCTVGGTLKEGMPSFLNLLGRSAALCTCYQ